MQWWFLWDDPTHSLLVVEGLEFVNEAAVVDSFLVSVSSHNLIEEVSIVLLKILRDLGSSLQYLHKVLHIYLIGAVLVNCEQVIRNIVQVFGEEQLPLVKWSQFLSVLLVSFDFLHDACITSSDSPHKGGVNA